jgi:hypothetical protein
MLLHMMFSTRCCSCGPEESVRGNVHCVLVSFGNYCVFNIRFLSEYSRENSAPAVLILVACCTCSKACQKSCITTMCYALWAKLNSKNNHIFNFKFPLCIIVTYAFIRRLILNTDNIICVYKSNCTLVHAPTCSGSYDPSSGSISRTQLKLHRAVHLWLTCVVGVW